MSEPLYRITIEQIADSPTAYAARLEYKGAEWSSCTGPSLWSALDSAVCDVAQIEAFEEGER